MGTGGDTCCQLSLFPPLHWGWACMVPSGPLDDVLASGYIFSKTFHSSKGWTPTLALSRPFYPWILCGVSQHCVGSQCWGEGQIWGPWGGSGVDAGPMEQGGRGRMQSSTQSVRFLFLGCNHSCGPQGALTLLLPDLPYFQGVSGDPPPWTSPKTPLNTARMLKKNLNFSMFILVPHVSPELFLAVPHLPLLCGCSEKSHPSLTGKHPAGARKAFTEWVSESFVKANANRKLMITAPNDMGHLAGNPKFRHALDVRSGALGHEIFSDPLEITQVVGYSSNNRGKLSAEASSCFRLLR